MQPEVMLAFFGFGLVVAKAIQLWIVWELKREEDD